MKKEIILGENKIHMNYMHNVYDDNYQGKVVAHLTFEKENSENVKNRDYSRKEKNVKDLMKEIRDVCEVDITFANRKAIDDMINNLIRIRDLTEWDWRDDENE